MSEPTFLLAMRRAMLLAQRGIPAVAPNPAVGAVLVKDGQVVAEGWHEFFGGPHAEINCLEDAARKSVNPAECAMVITLEPCNHYGKTPPCSQAILKAGIKHVVVGFFDPTPKAGGGAEFLRAHGVKVEPGPRPGAGFFVLAEKPSSFCHPKDGLHPGWLCSHQKREIEVD